MIYCFRIAALLCWITACYAAYLLPEIFGITVSLALVAAIATSVIPYLFFGLFPFVLVLGDGYLFTGNLVVQPSDAILLASVGGFIWRIGSNDALPKKAMTAFDWILILWCIGCSIAFVVGWTKLPTTDWGDQLSVYFSRWNAMRIGRGFTWAALFFLMSRFSNASGTIAADAFSIGMQSTLLAVGAIVVVERGLFEGLWDFSREFRATGPFSSMHIGGQHLDAFLTLSLPFAFFRFRERNKWGKALTLLLVLLTAYAAISTMSRATLAIVLASITILSIVDPTWFKTGLEDERWLRKATYSSIGLLVVGVAIITAWKADAIRHRFSTLRADWETRVTHWTMSLTESRRSWGNLLLGHGMGTFPSIQARSQNSPFPPLTWHAANSGTVRVSPEWPIYLQQWIRSPTSPSGICELKVRAVDGNASIGIAICKQALLKSYHCQEDHFLLQESTGKTWQDVSIQLPPSHLTTSTIGFASKDFRPTSFSIFHAGGPGTIEIANVSFSPGNNSKKLLANGAFYPGTEKWFFSSDEHLAWHTKNVFVHLLFEHGLVGLLIFLTILALWFDSTFRSCRLAPERMALVFVLSIVGTLGVAMFDSLLDTPILVALFFAVIFATPKI